MLDFLPWHGEAVTEGFRPPESCPKNGIPQSASLTASPIPFVPSGHFPLTRGIGLAMTGFLTALAPPVGELAAELTERAGYGLPRRCAPRNDGELGIDFFPYHVILKIKRGAAGRREPPFTKRSNRTVGTVGRLLLFIVVNMDEQSQNAHDELTDQDQFRMSHHMYHLPPRKRRFYKRSAASSRKRGLPPTEYWQRQRISMRRRHYSTFCRIWQS